MAKPITAYVKLQIPAGQATPRRRYDQLWTTRAQHRPVCQRI